MTNSSNRLDINSAQISSRPDGNSVERSRRLDNSSVQRLTTLNNISGQSQVTVETEEFISVQSSWFDSNSMYRLRRLEQLHFHLDVEQIGCHKNVKNFITGDIEFVLCSLLRLHLLTLGLMDEEITHYLQKVKPEKNQVQYYLIYYLCMLIIFISYSNFEILI